MSTICSGKGDRFLLFGMHNSRAIGCIDAFSTSPGKTNAMCIAVLQRGL